MESDDELLSELKVEFDVAAEPDHPWGSQHQCSGASNWSQRGVESATSETDCWNPSAAAMKREPDSQLASGRGTKAEPADESNDGTGDVFHQFQSADNREGKVDFKCDFSHEPGSSADLCPSPVDHADSNETVRADLEKERRQHVCDVCSKAFTQTAHLKTHMLLHSGLKPFVCNVCGKAFAQAGNMKTHTRIHTKERPYKCPHCDADFNQSCNLQTHIRAVHAGARPHVCQVCGAAFSYPSVLEQHKMIHTGEKPHACTICGKQFAMSGHLTRHTLVHFGKKPHPCPHCPAAYVNSRCLKKHVQKLHQ